MAASNPEPALPSPAFFDIYTDGGLPRNPANLPAGGCNFVDLAPGANGAKCGCRHFWSRFAAGRAFADNIGSDNSAWCMCGHHACYHDYGGVTEPPTPVAAIPGQENEKPRANREPLSPVAQDAVSFRLPSGTSRTVDILPQDSVVSAPPKKPEDLANRPPDQSSLPPESTLPDTLSWGELIHSQSANAGLPPIPQQCLISSSQQSSTSSSTHARYLRPFSGKGLATLSGVSQAKARSLPKEARRTTQIPPSRPIERDGSPAVVNLTSKDAIPGNSPLPSTLPQPSSQSQIFGAPSRETFRHLSDTVEGHETRIDRLENVSFTAGAHDECHNKYDTMDLRMTDLEVRMEEVEKVANDNGSIAGTRRSADESTNSVISVSTNATARATESAEIYEHIRSLETQVKQLRAYTPSFAHPWEIEVVFLPFPLRRVWQESHDFKTEPSADMDAWTQMPNTQSTATTRAQSPFCGDWSEPGIDYSWLLPKACMAQGLIDKRLRSRGLVQTVSVRSPDARSVQAALHAAFGTIIPNIATSSPSETGRQRPAASKIARFFGLQQPLVPLRKVHKDDRLRFLSPAEMVTPTLWDVPFLSSVVMRSSQPRLFVTQPEAYLQDLHAYDSGWTWQKVRELSRVYPDTVGRLEVPEADAMEEYWAWNERMDEPPSLQSSLSSQQARQSIPASPSQHFFTIKSSMRSASPRVSRVHSQGRGKEREPQQNRPLHVRTSSMPPFAPPPLSPAGVKRRVASYGLRAHAGPSSPLMHARSSPMPAAATATALAQKRMRTRSPSRPHNTPRWTMSPSPGIAAFPSDNIRLQARGVTPLYYATPFSNAPVAEARSRGSAAPGRDYASGDDEDYDDIYDSGTTNIYEDGDDDASGTSVELVAHHIIGQGNYSQPRQPEDEPWPGIEDQDRVSDGENIDPLFSPTADDDATSVASSQPSEYPSTQRGWELPGPNEGAGFHIHEDVQMPDSQ